MTYQHSNPAMDAYFEVQAEFGLTKHIGGQAATDVLMRLCGIGPGVRVLEGGCGVGVTSVYMARELGASVTGVDLYPAMIARARERAIRQGVAGAIDFQVADLHKLPFEPAAFDAVICESVVAFAADKQQVVNELVRVARPGGHVGLTEGVWKPDAPAEARNYMSDVSGSQIMAHEEWTALLANAGLQDITAETRLVQMRQEARDQLRRTDLSEYARAIGRFARSVVTSAQYRGWMKQVMKMPKLDAVMEHIAYGIYAGRKP